MKRIPTSGQWSEISKLITNNFELISADILELKNSLHSGTLGYFDTLGTLQSAYPNPSDGSRAFVGTAAPYKVYYYTDATGWYDTGETDSGSGGVAQIKSLSLNTSTKNTTIVATMSDGTSLSVALPNYTDIIQSGKWGLIEGYDYDSLITLKGLEDYVQRLIEVAQRGADALIAYQFGGVVNGVTTETSSTVANSGFIVYDNTLQQFLLLVTGLPSKYYMSWAGGTAAESSTVWNGDEASSGRRVNGSRFYTTNEDGTLVWHYYDDGTMYKVNGEVDSFLSDTSTNAVQNKVVTQVLNDYEERISSLEETGGGEVLSFEAPMVKDDTNVTLPLGQGLGLDATNKLALTDDIIAKIQTLALRQLYIAAGANYNSSTGYYELNGVNDIDEEEMSGIYVESLNIRVAANSYGGYPYRTTLKLHAAGQNENLINAFSSKYLISLGKTAPDYIAESPSLYGAFNASNNIRIVSNKAFYSVNAYGSAPFANAKELVQVLLRNNKTGFTIKDSLRISYYSLNYLATNASGTAFTVTLPEAQANILYLINRDYAGDVIDDIEENTLDDIGEIIATLPWEAKLKSTYPNPIWNEDNGGSIIWDSANNGGCGVPCEYYSYLNADIANVDGGFTDARPSLIKHATGVDGSQIYASWVGYVITKLASDLRAAGTKIAQFTTATNVTFATSIQDWINLAVKFGEKNITIAGHTTT